ncbi:MAG: AAA family ATPase [Gammaproteobacteria bacterium]|nr:AAA family ATPase [Gammaproteobacteria bacterium]
MDLEGEPGIGKSRIVHELLHKISSTPHMQLFYQCSPYFSSTALYPILNAIERQAGFHKEDSVEVRLKKLEHVLSSSNAPVDTTLPVFAWLLAISTEGQHKLPDISPQRQKEITQKTFIDWVVNLAEIHPVLLVVEDAQWIDPTSRELLDGLIERAQALPILVVVTSRPDSSWSWDSGTPVTSLTLGRLSRNQIAALIKSHSSNTEISDQAVSYIEEKSVGIPLFAEELTKAAIETGLDTVEILDWPLETTPAVEIPSSVQSSLLARLDRLGSVKEIAQIAATIGGDFDADLLKKISKRPAVAIAKALEQLTESDLISCNNKSARPTYVFKHKLLQDAARGTLLRSHRQTLHDQIAQTLLEAYPEVSVAHPELLAQHFTEANKLDQAVDYWLLAGRRAARTWAKQEAVKLMEKGIEVLQKLPVNQARRRKELDIQLERGDAASAAFGHATAESHEAYQRAWELSEQLNDTPATIRALDGLSGIRFNSASFNTARDASDRLINLGEVSGNLSALVRGLQGTGMCLFAQGELCSARTYLERALTFEDQADEVGADFPSMTTMYLASTLHILGYHQRAVDLYLRAQAIARDQTVYNLAASLGNGCHLYGFRDEFESINKLTDELIPLAQENGLNMWLNLGTFFRGWALANSEQTEKGTALMQDTINHIGGDELEMSYFLGLMARAYWRSGRIEEAEGALDQAVAQAEKTGEHFYTAELIRLNGELLLDTKKNLLAAEQCFRDAIAFSNNQEARSWELRAANSLARLLTMQGLREEAQQVLTPVQKWFDRV